MDELVKRVLNKMNAQEASRPLSELDAEEAAKPADALLGVGTFRDSGRKTGNLGEMLDSAVGVPARIGISEAQKGNWWNAIPAMAARVGTDPVNAPTGVDIASEATSNPYLGAGLATAVDLAQLPTGGVLPGVVGKVETSQNALKLAVQEALKSKKLEKFSPKIQQAYAELVAGGSPAVEGVSDSSMKLLELLKARGDFKPSAGFKITGKGQ